MENNGFFSKFYFCVFAMLPKSLDFLIVVVAEILNRFVIARSCHRQRAYNPDREAETERAGISPNLRWIASLITILGNDAATKKYNNKFQKKSNKFHILCILLLSLMRPFPAAYASSQPPDTMDTVTRILENLTCDIQGVGNLLRTEFSHTCIPAPYATAAVAAIISPGIYPITMLHLKINDNELFPNSCKRNNRIDPSNPVLSFALCNNLKLALASGEAVVNSIVAIANAQLTGTDPWAGVAASFNIPKASYHEIYKDQPDGAQGVMVDIVPIFWKVIKEKDRMCVATIAFTGWIPVGCKYIREPYPDSIYSDFMSPNPPAVTDPKNLTSCSSSGGCYQNAYTNSKTGIVITGPLIECIRQMSARLLVDKDVCDFSDLNSVIGSAKKQSSSLFQFQQNMHRFVAGLLTLYVMIYGFKIILAGDVPPKNDVITFVLKIIFVTYFSIGININLAGGGGDTKVDGLVSWLMPFMLGAINQLASWIINASPSDLCKFSSADYPASLSYMALWDSLDCRVSHYLGLDVLATMIVEQASRSGDHINFDSFHFAVPPYYYLLVPAFLSGQMLLVNLALMYPLLVISVAAYLVNSTVVGMLAIVILGMLAPLFVPMLLFDYTKGYFESWIKLMISFVLQPMVVTTFMITMFSVYDFGFYGDCKYKSADMSIGDRTAKIFVIDDDFGGGKYTPEQQKSCKNSFGYMINHPISSAIDFTKNTVKDALKTDTDQSTDENVRKYGFLGSLVASPGLFISAPKLIFDQIKNMVLAMITACFTLYLLYHFSAQLSEFAADITEGVSVSSVAMNSQTLFNAGQKALLAAGKMGSAKSQNVTRKALEAKDKISSAGGAKAVNSVTSGGKATSGSSGGGGVGNKSEAEDTISSGSAFGSGGVSRKSTPASDMVSVRPKDIEQVDPNIPVMRVNHEKLQKQEQEQKQAELEKKKQEEEAKKKAEEAKREQEKARVLEESRKEQEVKQRQESKAREDAGQGLEDKKIAGENVQDDKKYGKDGGGQS